MDVDVNVDVERVERVDVICAMGGGRGRRSEGEYFIAENESAGMKHCCFALLSSGTIVRLSLSQSG